MRLRFGIGMVFLPVGLVMSTECVVAASFGSRLSDMLAGLLSPFILSLPAEGASAEATDVPVPAVVVPDEPEQDVLASPSKAQRPKNGVQPGRSGELPAIHIRADRVLRIANSGQRPSGRSVTADGARPAGVQVFGASSLGVGVRDGDVITDVAGVAVASAGQVIALVIAARGSRQPAISARIYRGRRSYVLTVEQPYPPEVDEPPRRNDGPDAGVGPK